MKPRQRPVFVLVHGLGGSSRAWAALAEVLSQHAEVLTPELAGHGTAAGKPGPWSITRYAADVAAEIEARGMRDTILIGHSMGGAVAVQAAVAASERVRDVVVLDGLIFPELYGRWARRKAPLARLALRTPAASRLIDHWLSRFFLSDHDPASYQAAEHDLRTTPRAVLGDATASLLSWDRDRWLGRLPVPLTVLYAEAVDRARALELPARRVTVIPVPAGGHYFFAEYPRELATTLLEIAASRSD